jgi:hypothetical protein
VSIQAVREIPQQLPPARLFLDDVDAITTILSEAQKGSGESVVPVKYKVKGKFICDTLSDLKKLGGAVTDFEVKVGRNRWTLSRYYSGWDVWTADPEITLATYAKLLRVFDNRKMMLNTAVRDLPVWSIPLAIFTVMAVADLFGRWSVHHRQAPLVFGILLSGIVTGLYLLFLKHSVVELRYSHEDRSLYEALKASNPLAVAVVAAIAGAVVTVVIEQLFKWLWP